MFIIIFGKIDNIVSKCFTYVEDTISIPEKYDHENYLIL